MKPYCTNGEEMGLEIVDLQSKNLRMFHFGGIFDFILYFTFKRTIKQNVFRFLENTNVPI